MTRNMTLSVHDSLKGQVKNNEATQKYYIQGINSAVMAYLCYQKKWCWNVLNTFHFHKWKWNVLLETYDFWAIL